MKKEKLSEFLGDDITYCAADECINKDCFRHPSNIDWNTPKHKHLGASVSAFQTICEDYKTKEEK